MVSYLKHKHGKYNNLFYKTTLTPTCDQDRISPLCPYNIEQKNDWNNEKYLYLGGLFRYTEYRG